MTALLLPQSDPHIPLYFKQFLSVGADSCCRFHSDDLLRFIGFSLKRIVVFVEFIIAAVGNRVVQSGQISRNLCP